MAVTQPKSREKQQRKELAARAPAPDSPMDGPAVGHEDWPPQELILSAIEAGRQGNEQTGPRLAQDRRATRSASVTAFAAGWRLFSDAPGEEGRVIYTRDIHSRGLGFITPTGCPWATAASSSADAGREDCVDPLHPAALPRGAPGWYEGSVYFNREQQSVVPKNAG